MTIERIFIAVEINYWKGESKNIKNAAFLTADECKKYFDDKNSNDDDYCHKRSKWKFDNGDWIKGVDHDGAFVRYIAMEIKVLS